MALRVGSITVLQRPAFAVDTPTAKYGGLHPSSTTLPAGHVKAPGLRPLPVDTVYDRDQIVTMRDGIKLRVDYFRPTGDEKVPALLAWSPYGKSGTGIFDLNLIPGRVGVKEERLSAYEKFEAPDPAEWVQKGYAIANIHARGVFDSEGDIRWFGTAEGRDGHDAVEEIAKLPWCNGKVAMVGNSWLAMTQWLTAAERPPHLACIAPFEGCSDVYRETLCRGGVPYTPFWGFLATTFYGRNQQEDILAMLEKYPYMNEYWEDKRAKIEKIEVPAYVLASYSTGLHTLGSIRAYEDLRHENKWLCIHSTQEWHDLYSKERVDDLQKFLDFYTKGIQNDWPSTPRVRVSILDFNQMEAGSDTTASTLLSFCLAMINYPNALRKCQAEVDALCIDHSPNSDGIPKLPYIHACMNEVLRWRPVAAGGIPHVVTEDDVYGDYVIPKGTMLFANTWAIHQDESQYHCPAEFCPERWLNNKYGTKMTNAETDGRRVTYGFGAGRRVCSGQRLAENSLMVNMAKLVWTFDITSNGPADTSIETGYTSGFLLCPKKFPAVFTVRSEEKAEIVEAEYVKAKQFLRRFEE